MEWIKRFNDAMAYLEEHLTETPDYEALGRIACCSGYHFQRMFAYMADLTLTEYIRRRRMSLAAADLQSGAKILDTALKYGYSSPTAFNRAFQGIHGIPPSAAQKPGAALKSFPPISFTITIKGAEKMEYRIEKRDAFRIVGVAVPLAKELEQNFITLPAKWQEAAENGTLQRLVSMINSEPQGILGVSVCLENEPWRYYISAASDCPAEGLDSYIVPAASWAVFAGEGRGSSIQELERRILTEWLPSSGYEYGVGPDIEVYLNDDMEHARYEVWIPVVKAGKF